VTLGAKTPRLLATIRTLDIASSDSVVCHIGILHPTQWHNIHAILADPGHSGPHPMPNLTRWYSFMRWYLISELKLTALTTCDELQLVNRIPGALPNAGLEKQLYLRKGSWFRVLLDSDMRACGQVCYCRISGGSQQTLRLGETDVEGAIL
jgi:hypothetical protein